MLQRLTISILLALTALNSYAQRQPIQYMIFDGLTYMPDQLELASKSPVKRSPPRLSRDGSLLIPRAPDGHYYVSGTINGFPITFMVDTGATYTAIPGSLARNCGLRVGRVGITNTAAGIATGTLSTENVVTLGTFELNKVTISTTERLHAPLLGMDILGRFKITQNNGIMALSMQSSQ